MSYGRWFAVLTIVFGSELYLVLEVQRPQWVAQQEQEWLQHQNQRNYDREMEQRRERTLRNYDNYIRDRERSNNLNQH